MEQIVITTIVISMASIIFMVVLWGLFIRLFSYVIRYLFRWVVDGRRPDEFRSRPDLSERRNSHSMATTILFVIMLSIMFLMAINGKLVLAACLGVMALIILILLLRMKQQKEEAIGILRDLQAADKKRLFQNETHVLLAAWHSVLIKEDFFQGEGVADSVQESYELIRNAIEHDIQSATRFMEHYDWVLRPEPKYLRKITARSKALAGKLSELSDIVLEINDSSSDVDISFANDMLSSLKEMLSEED